MADDAPTEESLPTAPEAIEPATGWGRLRHAAGPIALLAVFAIALGAVFWGAFGADVEIRVFTYDAGAETEWVVGTLTPLPGLDVYVVGIEDGRIRALDGIVESSGCAVEYLPDDTRNTARNPANRPGVFIDPCGPGVWATDGDALVGDEPLRTFVVVSPARDDDQPRRVLVEVLGRDRPEDDPRVVTP